MPLCSLCHEMFHPGLANTKGRLEIVLGRHRAINGPGFSMFDTSVYHKWIGDTFLHRTKYNWGLSFRHLANRFNADNPLVIKGEWVIDEKGFVYSKARDSFTLVTGVHWKNAGKGSPVHFMDSISVD